MERLKEGPLAPIWMAANYEKKLSKQQFLNTDIVTSTGLLNRPINPNSENITLRLSGQLLLGIVRIYSRKTKYLLDDVNDILYKLKNSFKLASGGVLLGSESSKNVNSQTSSHHNNFGSGHGNTLHNVNNMILQDQITSHDLLFQEDLDLKDSISELPATLFGQSQSRNQPDHSHDLDQSIEYGRYNQLDDDMGDNGADIDFDLNLDNNDDIDDLDASIEVGRNASNQTGGGPDFSLLDINDAYKEVNLGVDAPLETIDDYDNSNNNNSDPNTPPDLNEPETPPQTEIVLQGPAKPRKKLVGITEEGALKTNKRKLQVDTEQDLESGITIDELRRLQSLQLDENWREDSFTFQLSDKEKLQLIEELSEPAGFKKRKLWNLNSELSQICHKLSLQEQRAESNNQYDNNDDADGDSRNNLDDLSFEQDQSHAFDDLNFDLSIPELNDEPDNIEDNSITPRESDIASSTKTVADIIKNEHNQTTDFKTIVSKDSSSTERLPLGTSKRGNDNMLNMKKEASKCFFELLVLASHDCISIDQKEGPAVTDIGQDIHITAKDRLFSSFV